MKSEALIELIRFARTERLGLPFNPHYQVELEHQGGLLGQMQMQIATLEEKLAMTEDVLHSLMAWLEKYLEEN